MRRLVMFTLVAFGVGVLAEDASAFGKRKKMAASSAAVSCGCDGGYGYPSGGHYGTSYPGTAYYGAGYQGVNQYGTGYPAGWSSGYPPNYYPSANYTPSTNYSPVPLHMMPR